MPSWRNSERYRVESFRHPDHVAARAREHSLLLAALEEKDAVGALTLLASHLRSSMELVAAGLAGESPTRLRLPELAELLPGTASDDRHPGGEGTVVSAE